MTKTLYENLFKDSEKNKSHFKSRTDPVYCYTSIFILVHFRMYCI